MPAHESTDPPTPDDQPPSSAAKSTNRVDPPESPWRTLAAREVYRNPWLTVTEYAVVRPDGTPGIYGVVDPGDNACVLALDADDSVWLIGEFVYTLQRYEWMLPSGKIEAGEEPLHAARRELAEETGLTADDWQPLGAYALSSGVSTQVSHIFLARGLHVGAASPEGTERLAFKQISLRDACDACLRGEIRDAPSALGIWRAWLARYEVSEPERRGSRDLHR
jgi:8-oxo-dGDP phosphatase